MHVKALAKTRPGPGIELVDIPEPSPGPGEVLFAPEVTAICGSDVTMCDWTAWAPGTITDLPFVLGHEGCGTALAVGDGVERIAPGDRIAAETHIPCGHCWYCRNGRAHVCANMILFGVTTDGCFGELAKVNQRGVWKVDDRIPTEHGALLEPLGVALRSTDAVPLDGQPIAIVGAGPIGLLATAVASTRSPSALFVLEPDPARRSIAASIEGTTVLDPAGDNPAERILEQTEGVGVEVVIECSGNKNALLGSLSYLRTCGHLVAVGNAHEPVSLDVTAQIIKQELQLHGIWGRTLWGTWTAAEAFLIAHPDKIESIITGRYPLSQGLEAFDEACAGKGGKILIVNEQDQPNRRAMEV